MKRHNEVKHRIQVFLTESLSCIQHPFYAALQDEDVDTTTVAVSAFSAVPSDPELYRWVVTGDTYMRTPFIRLTLVSRIKGVRMKRQPG